MLIILLVIIFWAAIPGLINGWILWERGWNFPLAFLLGAICGPIGILVTLALISAGSFKSRHRRAQVSRGAHGRAFRVYYDVPIVGRIHVSTVWALAGVATFTCLWMLGGLGYEFYLTREGREAQETASGLTARTFNVTRASSEGSAQGAPPQGEPKSSAGSQPNASSTPNAPLVERFAAQSRQTAQMAASVNTSTPNSPPQSFASASALTNTAPPTTPHVAPPKTPAESSLATTVSNSPQKSSAPSREAVLSEVTRSLGAAGHKVHAALSGDAQTATLSLSGATLNRAAGHQLLSGRSRASLKAAGIRIVVMVNGQESWTYIL
ncbi:MAG: hypothetical protein LC802_21095 [Acidobacteria bacterium]|nr:hypothetical protein [Acidobacteriota bacterium]